MTTAERIQEKFRNTENHRPMGAILDEFFPNHTKTWSLRQNGVCDARAVRENQNPNHLYLYKGFCRNSTNYEGTHIANRQQRDNYLGQNAALHIINSSTLDPFTGLFTPLVTASGTDLRYNQRGEVSSFGFFHIMITNQNTVHFVFSEITEMCMHIGRPQLFEQLRTDLRNILHQPSDQERQVAIKAQKNNLIHVLKNTGESTIREAKQALFQGSMNKRNQVQNYANRHTHQNTILPLLSAFEKSMQDTKRIEHEHYHAYLKEMGRNPLIQSIEPSQYETGYINYHFHSIEAQLGEYKQYYQGITLHLPLEPNHAFLPRLTQNKSAPPQHPYAVIDLHNDTAQLDTSTIDQSLIELSTQRDAQKSITLINRYLQRLPTSHPLVQQAEENLKKT